MISDTGQMERKADAFDGLVDLICEYVDSSMPEAKPFHKLVTAKIPVLKIWYRVHEYGVYDALPLNVVIKENLAKHHE